MEALSFRMESEQGLLIYLVCFNITEVIHQKCNPRLLQNEIFQENTIPHLHILA